MAAFAANELVSWRVMDHHKHSFYTAESKIEAAQRLGAMHVCDR
jgi:hypothetical protein